MFQQSEKCMGYKKFDKPFVMSDSRVNEYGFRLLTSGFQLEDFKSNPIGYYGHNRDEGVLLKWDSVHLDGDSIIGYPVVNMDHPRGERTWNELEGGFLNAASMGKIKFLETELEDNPDDPENPIVCVPKWLAKECSLVDNPGNRGAMKVELADSDQEFDLSDVSNFLKTKHTMSKKMIELTPKLMQVLNLSDDATQEAFEAGVQHLATENDKLAKKADKAERDLKDATEASNKEKITAALDNAVKAGKIPVGARKKLEVQFADKPAELSDLLDEMLVYQSLVDKLESGDASGLPKDLADKNWDDLDRAGKLEGVREKYPEHFKALFDAKFSGK